MNPQAKTITLSAVPDDKAVKLTVDLSAAIHRDLAAYTELLAKVTCHIDRTSKAYCTMIARFMASARAFVKSKRVMG